MKPTGRNLFLTPQLRDLWVAVICALVIPVAGQILLSCVTQFRLIQRRFAATKILNQCFVGMDLETMGQIESQLRQRTLFFRKGPNEWSVTVPVEVDENNNYTGWDLTGTYLMSFGLPRKSLHVLGKKPCVVPPLKSVPGGRPDFVDLLSVYLSIAVRLPFRLPARGPSLVFVFSYPGYLMRQQFPVSPLFWEEIPVKGIQMPQEDNTNLNRICLLTC